MSEAQRPAMFILAGESAPGAGPKPSFDRASLPWVDNLTMLEALKQRFAAWRPKVVREDLIRGLGPLGGVYTALKASKDDWNLMVSCDMPFLTAGTLGRMFDSLAGHPHSRVAFIEAKVIHPFPCILHREMLQPVSTLLRTGKLDLMILVEKHPDLTALLPPAPASGEHEFFEVNSAADYEKAKVWAGV